LACRADSSSDISGEVGTALRATVGEAQGRHVIPAPFTKQRIIRGWSRHVIATTNYQTKSEQKPHREPQTTVE